jgi:FolB domain-containing protein
MDKIIITDLLVRGIIGVNNWEREQLQDILVNIEIEADLRKAGISDKLEDCISYSSVAKNIIAHVESAKRFTVEALAEDIAALCLKEPGALKARVRVEKPGVVRFAQSVGVEIERPAKIKQK